MLTSTLARSKTSHLHTRHVQHRLRLYRQRSSDLFPRGIPWEGCCPAYWSLGPVRSSYILTLPGLGYIKLKGVGNIGTPHIFLRSFTKISLQCLAPVSCPYRFRVRRSTGTMMALEDKPESVLMLPITTPSLEVTILFMDLCRSCLDRMSCIR